MLWISIPRGIFASGIALPTSKDAAGPLTTVRPTASPSGASM